VRLAGTDKEMDVHFGEGPSMGLAGDADWSEEASAGDRGIEIVQQTITEGAEGVVAEGALAGGGIGPPTHPAGGAKTVESLLHAPFGGVCEIKRMEINPLPVLHNLVDEDFLRLRGTHPAGDGRKPQALGCLVAALARDDLV